ncbi:LacI family transcriptional regulator [Clostridium butyricum]|uniref:LacI family transcriptional regulator n=1 Tax=Clostridium butyricum TaxID=1492 RepID=A0A512THS3_CLOBU|nr:LacI family DNA-binding transcriptional regulator [Clostridium butyricum]NOW23002.1 LacI family transcriptional regulator [Clostridium butyricum]GEQ19807.1 LacI family transcriptional regulator [Clostridium butyricum]
MPVTISDIAKKAKVSQSTVSRVLNGSGYVKEETKNRIEAVIKELNYTPSAIARSLSKRETNAIGVIVPDITNSYFGEVIKGISQVADKNNLNIIFYNTENSFEKEIRALNLLKEQRIKGIIMTPGFGADDFDSTYKEIIESLQCPLILACADVTSTELNGVFVDNIKGAYDSVKLLIERGHKRIGILLGPLSSEPMSQRLLGYKKALIENNIKVKENYILKADFTCENAYEITKEMLDSKECPSALIVCTNRMTMGVIKAVEEYKKKIPNDLAIIGSDKNDVLDMFGLNLTYIEECPLLLGKSAMKLLCNILNDSKTEKTRTIISPQIIIRGSERFE